MSDLKHYLRPPAKDQNEKAVKNLMANLERYQGLPPGEKNTRHEDAMHKMLALCLNGGPGLKVFKR